MDSFCDRKGGSNRTDTRLTRELKDSNNDIWLVEVNACSEHFKSLKT